MGKIQTEDVYEILKNRIITLEYSPGQVLNEADIAGEFDLSRTPVRKIFEQLKNRKLLNIIPRYGAQVATIDFRYMKSVFEVVRELEGFAIRLAVERITDEDIEELENIVERINNYDIENEYKKIIIDDENFHRIVIQSSDNPCLIEILFDLHMHTERLWFYSQQELTDLNMFHDTLADVVKAIKARDVVQAEFYSKKHTDDFVNLIKKELL
ncbi:GntR family transcriptional regulator [Dehalobacterium formicoaceticum]|uniref:GntR family transcriptional regulator n=1 Tax=Dehalobacterium formicoaceticum TaxID=51515 RepID=A0ABT1XZM8_9FIRM|nr:GntR family transcriptional regulator [Dehalobacterium formicoaceticum]MCR6544063.1 GntR family transcriptional regulator [Dehalobacterium formicoaceticum]